MKLYMFRAVPLPIIRSLLTEHLAVVYVIQVCRQLLSRTKMEQVLFCSIQNKTSSILVLLESCLQTCMTYTIVECTVSKPLMMGRGTA